MKYPQRLNIEMLTKVLQYIALTLIIFAIAKLIYFVHESTFIIDRMGEAAKFYKIDSPERADPDRVYDSFNSLQIYQREIKASQDLLRKEINDLQLFMMVIFIPLLIITLIKVFISLKHKGIKAGEE